MVSLSRSVPSLALAAMLISGCATSSPALRPWEVAERVDGSTCDTPGADQCIVWACDEGECGVFGCEDVDPEAVASAALSNEVEWARNFRLSFEHLELTATGGERVSERMPVLG